MRRIFPGGTLPEQHRTLCGVRRNAGIMEKLLELSASVEENLTTLFLEKNSFLPELMIKWLSEELRETAVYNTILATIADEKNGKLNAMYARTGFSRAKISVYLKNLMELELVEKVLPGTYEISNSFIRFYFRFLFPHQTAWRRDNGRAFYETYIREDYSSFVRSAYRRICQEILQADFHTVELKKAAQGRTYFMQRYCRKKIVVDYSGTVCYTSEDYDALQTALKKHPDGNWMR